MKKEMVGEQPVESEEVLLEELGQAMGLWKAKLHQREIIFRQKVVVKFELPPEVEAVADELHLIGDEAPGAAMTGDVLKVSLISLLLWILIIASVRRRCSRL